ncbi:MAG TPA: RsmE family RNA methyltransferase [Gemmatimonadaceae bacterium]|nr:RsmE family RNA methyltransferase [Gemmatimonadaceae bacterium]
MAQRHAQRPVATLFSDELIDRGRSLTLGADEAQHARVLRLAIGDRVRVTDGAGRVGVGTLVRHSKSHAVVDVDDVRHLDAPPAIHLLVPVADRERMLLLAEKATELGAASWRPVLWRRSRSVAPRGEGVTFHGKLRARMLAALTQSGGGWLPTVYPEASLERALAAAPDGARLLLEAAGEPILRRVRSAPVICAVGPEGGIEADERSQLLAEGFDPVSLAPSILRFETASIGALAVIRAALIASEEFPRG